MSPLPVQSICCRRFEHGDNLDYWIVIAPLYHLSVIERVNNRGGYLLRCWSNTWYMLCAKDYVGGKTAWLEMAIGWGERGAANENLKGSAVTLRCALANSLCFALRQPTTTSYMICCQPLASTVVRVKRERVHLEVCINVVFRDYATTLAVNRSPGRPSGRGHFLIVMCLFSNWARLCRHHTYL